MSQPEASPPLSQRVVRSECHSRSSRSSRRSSTSQAAARARAEAEAARTRAQYAKRQIDMEVEKARIEATLNPLKKEGEAEAAVAAAHILEAAAEEEQDAVDLTEQGVPSKTPPSIRRAQDYVNAHFASYSLVVNEDRKPDTGQLVGNNDAQYPRQSQPPAASSPGEHLTDFVGQEQPKSPPTHRKTDIATHPKSAMPSQTELSDFTAYLARRDLLTAGFKVFDNRPESYLSWKSIFCNAIEGLNLKSSEELDLLTKWLSGESLQHALRIRAVHVNNPQAGLQRLWQRLDKNFGSPEVVEASLFQRLQSFPKISNKDTQLLQELADLLLELEYAQSENYLPGLSFLDTPRGINPIVEKLPYGLQESWVKQGTKYKRDNGAVYPPFSYFVQFINDYAEMKTDPSFMLQSSNIVAPKPDKSLGKPTKYRVPIAVNRTDISQTNVTAQTVVLHPDRQCPIHHKPHSLTKCRGFRAKTLDERKSILKEHAICYKCCSSTGHRARDCKAIIQCSECDSDAHVSAMHAGPPPWATKDSILLPQGHGGEPDPPSPVTTTACTEVCGPGLKGKSCSKICLVDVYPRTNPEEKRRMYAMLDDQSNSSLARSAFFDMFNVKGTMLPYTMKTCAGLSEAGGRRATNFVIQDVNGKVSMLLPTLTECDHIPDNRDEIPTKEAVSAHPHLQALATQIPPLDPAADILLLLGRDIVQAHKVRSQVNGPNSAPYAQRLDLGWVVVGNVCLSGAHKPTVNSFKTDILNNGRPTFFSPCENKIHVKDKYTECCPTFEKTQTDVGRHIFQQTVDDDKIALSAEDALFLEIMHRDFTKDEANNWVAPLPFRSPRQRLPNNRDQALSRLMSLRKMLKKKPEMKEHYIEFLDKTFSKGHAEPAPALAPEQECWYLPSFGIYHPQKPGKIRVVFDSSAQYSNVSLNDVLLKGPDLNNTLVGVLMRFRSDPYAVMADVEQMFYNFVVREDHRNYLRFLWFENHNLDGEVQEFRMRVHVFGNCPSPSVAIYGLKRTAMEGEKEHGKDVREFIERHFYVDDGLKSFPSTDEAINILCGAQKMLAQCNIRLHKIASNCPTITNAFPKEDLAADMQGLDLRQTPMQRSLGLGWDLSTDLFRFQTTVNEKPFTRRGVLSVVNSVYDPLGFAVPVIVEGRVILRDISADGCEWDTELPKDKLQQWQQWKHSLKHLQQLEVPRMFTSIPLSAAVTKEIHVFCDASTKAVGAVAYLKLTDRDGRNEVGFLLGKARLAPRPDITIPRLELCAAVLAVEVAELVVDELDIAMDQVSFYSDSKVVLGYIFNTKRRFYIYVHNRVECIRRSTQAHQWHYVPTHLNPADHATRALPAEQLSTSTWLSGPAFLTKSETGQSQAESFDLVDPETDNELRRVTTFAKDGLSGARFERFSSWNALLKAISKLRHMAQSFKQNIEGTCQGWHSCSEHLSEKQLDQAKIIIIRTIQREVYAEDIRQLEKRMPLKSSSPLNKLNPFLDTNGVLRVGGRLRRAQLTLEETNPILIPAKHHLAQLIIRHFHVKVCHQGRHFTEGAVRAAGFWIVGGKRAISKMIFNCVTCRKLRGRRQEQIMAELPEDRLSTDPPFTHVGLDVFGPWPVTVRKTRGGQADAKRWAVLFTCMSTRAIHIEVIESMDTSSFINALRRFFAIRGAVKLLRSDCGTNFVSACKELQIDKQGCYNSKLSSFLQDSGCKWLFNPPHASHMAGSWERMIGVTRKILDAMFLEHRNAKLTHEMLVTLMAEVTAIVNARPLTAVSADPDNPVILTPAVLLTQKVTTPPIPPGQFGDRDLFKAQWRRVQYLADVFWRRWKREYISGLQERHKWKAVKPNLQTGDVVLLKETLEHRNNWPLGLITKTFPSEDGLVRKIEVKIFRKGEHRCYIRPISEVVLLVSKDCT